MANHLYIKLKRSGPRIESCGTPVLIWNNDSL